MIGKRDNARNGKLPGNPSSASAIRGCERITIDRNPRDWR